MKKRMDAKSPFICGDEAELRVDALVSDGRGLARHEGIAVFIQDALPGQLVRAKLTSVRSRMAEAEVIEVLERSADESEAPCPHSSLCGGCMWQSLQYEHQLRWKERVVRDALERVGKIANPTILPIIPSPEPWGYRNKMEFAFAGESVTGKILLGLRERGSRRIVEVTECLLQSPLTMRVVAAMRDLVREEGLSAWEPEIQRGTCRFLVVREPGAGGCFVELITGTDADAALGKRLDLALRSRVPEVTGFTLSRRESQGDVAYGDVALYQAGGQFEEKVGHVRLQLDHNAFFQVNTAAAALLYAEVERLSGITESPCHVLWDVYSGIGAIGLYLARHMATGQMIGVESVSGAVRRARSNARELGVLNYKVEAGEARSVLGRLASIGPKPDVVIVDPPRVGVDEVSLRHIQKAEPQRIVYVSCNPATLARDAQRLSAMYTLTATRPVDLFPQTPHVESVSVFERK